MDIQKRTIKFREIKFRGKRLDNGDWWIGCLVITGMSGVYIVGTHLQCKSDGNSVKVRDKLEHCEVNSKTVGQYTGLKDKNGKEIWEGDIVRFSYWWFDGNVRETPLTGTIIYSSDKMSFQLKGVKNQEWEEFVGCVDDKEYLTPFSELAFSEADFEIIGTIHDNPEILEEK